MSNVVTPEMYKSRTGVGGGIKEDVAKHKAHKNSKTRGNYPSGGWCGKSPTCRWHDSSVCSYCFRFSEYEKL